MSVYLLDTNIFLRIFSGLDNDRKGECEAVLKMIEKGDLKGVVPNLVLSEIVWTLSSYYKHTKKEKLLTALVWSAQRKTKANLTFRHVADVISLFR